MAREELDFYRRSKEDQQAFLKQTWCNNCMEMDLGMTDPVEYQDQGRHLIEGRCSKCGEPVYTEIVEEAGEEGSD